MHPFLYELGQDRHAELLREAELERLIRAAKRSSEAAGGGGQRPRAQGAAALGTLLIALGTWLQKRSNIAPGAPCAEQTPRQAMAG